MTRTQNYILNVIYRTGPATPEALTKRFYLGMTSPETQRALIINDLVRLRLLEKLRVTLDINGTQHYLPPADMAVQTAESAYVHRKYLEPDSEQILSTVEQHPGITLPQLAETLSSPWPIAHHTDQYNSRPFTRNLNFLLDSGFLILCTNHQEDEIFYTPDQHTALYP